MCASGWLDDVLVCDVFVRDQDEELEHKQHVHLKHQTAGMGKPT